MGVLQPDEQACGHPHLKFAVERVIAHRTLGGR
jgi:hypothetical protein